MHEHYTDRSNRTCTDKKNNMPKDLIYSLFSYLHLNISETYIVKGLVIIFTIQDPPLIAKTFIPFDCKYVAPKKPTTFRPITKANIFHGVFFFSSIIGMSNSQNLFLLT